jgi:hypothetical protein
MARGWESKSVEDQMESAASRRAHRVSGPRPSVAEVEVLRIRETIVLSRTRILHELETSRNPRYLTLLKRELTALEEQLRHLN